MYEDMNKSKDYSHIDKNYYRGMYKNINIDESWGFIQDEELKDLYEYLVITDQESEQGICPYTKEKSDLCKLLYRDYKFQGKVVDGYIKRKTMINIEKYLSEKN